MTFGLLDFILDDVAIQLGLDTVEFKKVVNKVLSSHFPKKEEEQCCIEDCTKKASEKTDDKNYCSKHFKKVNVKVYCTYILTTKKKGEQCSNQPLSNSKYCKTHKKYEKLVEEVIEEPIEEPVEEVVEEVVEEDPIETLKIKIKNDMNTKCNVVITNENYNRKITNEMLVKHIEEQYTNLKIVFPNLKELKDIKAKEKSKKIQKSQLFNLIYNSVLDPVFVL